MLCYDAYDNDIMKPFRDRVLQMQGYALINQYHDSLKDWEALNREEQINLRSLWLDEEVRYSWLYGAIGGGLGFLFHEAARAGGVISSKYAIGTAGSSAVVGAVGLYYLFPIVEKMGYAKQFDEIYPIKEI